jgi:hypothetical protein
MPILPLLPLSCLTALPIPGGQWTARAGKGRRGRGRDKNPAREQKFTHFRGNKKRRKNMKTEAKHNISWFMSFDGELRAAAVESVVVQSDEEDASPTWRQT